MDKASEQQTPRAAVASSLLAREQAFITDFFLLDDWMLQYEFLLYHIEDIHDVPDGARTDALRIKGCVSTAWMRLSRRDGQKILLELSSDALIIKGILGVITAIIGDADLAEIAAWRPSFIEKTSLNIQLSVDRQKGIGAILEEIRAFARMS